MKGMQELWIVRFLTFFLLGKKKGGKRGEGRGERHPLIFSWEERGDKQVQLLKRRER